MTNKHKKTTTKKKPKVEKEAAAAPATDGETEPEKGFFEQFEGSQLGSLIMLGIGFYKVYELSIAYQESAEDPISCMSYLGDEATCSHPSFPSMILAKYHTSFNLLSLVGIMIMLVWNTELHFSKLTTCLCISPLSTTILGVCLSQHELKRGKIINMLLICFALLCTCAPNSKEKIPFVSDQPLKVKSLSSLALIALASTHVFDVIRLDGGELGRANGLLETATPLPEKAEILVNFWCMDKLSMVLLYLLALVHFPEDLQKSFLFYVCGLKLFEGIFQIAWMIEPFQHSEMVQALVMGTAILSGLSQMSPATKNKAE